jgi:SPOR domain
MFRLLFWLLLLANLVLLTLLPGPLPGTATLEPQRLLQQVQADSVKLLPNPRTNDAAMLAPTPEPCVEMGDFSATIAAKFESRMAKLKLPSLPLKQQVQSPQASLVFIPPQSDEANANRRITKLRALGFTDVSVVREPLAMRWGISVGLFASPDLAAAQLENLKKAGITDARIEEHPLNSARFSYQLKGYAGEDKPELKALIAEFSGVSLRSCKH